MNPRLTDEADPPGRGPGPGAPDPYGAGAIWRLAGPMILSSVTFPLVGLVGTAVLGHLDDHAYLAGAAAGTQVFNVLFLGLNFLRMGTTGVTAQAAGAADHGALRLALGQAAIAALFLGVLLVVLQRPIIGLSLDLLGADPDVARYTREYFDLRIWSAPAALFNLVAVGWLLGMQNARAALLIALLVNASNILLDLWLVLGLGLAVRGVALGALLAEFAGAGLAVGLLSRELARHPGTWQRRDLLDPPSYLPLFRVNGNLFLRTLALMFTFSFITVQGARMGGVFLAANALLMNFQWFASYALDGLANAAEALVGRAIGARDRAGLRAAVRRTLAWSAGFAACFTGIYLVAGTAIIGLLTDLPDVRAVAAGYLPWLVASPLVSVWSFFYDGVFVGATRAREMRVVMVSAALLVFLPAWYFGQALGNGAIWLAFTLFMAARGLGMHLWFRRLSASGEILRRSAALPAP